MKKIITSTVAGLIGGALSAILILSFYWPETGQYPGFQKTSLEDTPVRSAGLDGLNASEATELNEDFISASSKSTHSVVYIRTTSQTRVNYNWMDLFFGQGGSQQTLSSGSGVIYSSDGYIITNNHVVDNAMKVEVIYNKKTYPAEVVGTDPSADLAVLKIEGNNFPAITVGKSSGVRVGEWVLAVGNPFNLETTVTAGIVSAKGRDLDILKNRFPIESFIQTDAAINPGNSGGALVNLKGELVGINTAIVSKTGSYAGYGFAVPSDIATKLADDLIKYGKVQKAFIGGEVADLTEEISSIIGTEELDGVAITYISEDGPADKAGLKKGDIIIAIDNNNIDTKAEFDEVISGRSPGDKVFIKYKRDNKIITTSMVLVNEDGSTGIVRNQAISSPDLGAEFEPLSKIEMEYFGIENGVRIQNIKQGVVSQIGISEGFILMRVNSAEVSSAEDAIDKIKTTKGRVVIEGKDKTGQNRYYSYRYY